MVGPYKQSYPISVGYTSINILLVTNKKYCQKKYSASTCNISEPLFLFTAVHQFKLPITKKKQKSHLDIKN